MLLDEIALQGGGQGSKELILRLESHMQLGELIYSMFRTFVEMQDRLSILSRGAGRSWRAENGVDIWWCRRRQQQYY